MAISTGYLIKMTFIRANIIINLFVQMAKQKKSNNKQSKSQPAQLKPKKLKTDANFTWEKAFWSRNWIPGIILLVLGMALYISSLPYEFVLDDKIVMSKNAYVKEGFGGISKILTSESMEGHFGGQRNLVVGGRYRPLSIITFAMEYGLFHDPAKIGLKESKYKEAECPECNTAISHFINVLLYGLTGLLLFRVLSLMFPLRKNKSWFFGLAFIAALLWVLHPIHSECVANIKGRDEILTLIGALATMYYSWRYASNGNLLWLWVSGILFLLALLAKENALTFLAVIPVSLYFFTKTSFKRIAISVLPLLIASGIYLAMRYQAIGYFLDSGKPVTDLMNNPFTNMSIGERFATVFYTLLLYLKLLIFPHPLTHDYYPMQIPTMSWTSPLSILSLLLHLGMGVFALLKIKSKNIFAYCIIFYIATLSIVSNIPFTVGTTMNERFVYISSIAFCIALAYFITNYLPRIKDGKFKYLSYGLLGLFVVGFIAKTIERVPAWKDTLSLNQAAIKVSKNSARANCFMGTAIFEYYRDKATPEEKPALLKESAAYVREALRIHPRYGSAMVMMSGLAAEEYKTDRDLDKLLQEFYNMLIIKKNLPFIEEYIAYLLPKADQTKLSAFCYKIGNDHFLKQNDFDYAIKYLKFGVQNEPGHARMNYALGGAYQLKGDEQNAQRYIHKAYQLDPSLKR